MISNIKIFSFAYLRALCDVQDAQMPQAHGCAGAVGEKLLTLGEIL